MLFEVKKYQVDQQPAAGAAAVVDGSQQQFASYTRLEDVIEIVDHGKTTHWFSLGDWSMHQMLQKLLEKTGPADVWISSYAFSEKPARLLCDLKDAGTIKDLYCIIDSRVDTRSASALTMIRNASTQIKLCETHAKITVIKNDQWFLVVVGSANYTSNKRFESGCICSNAVIANCYKILIEDELEKCLIKKTSGAACIDRRAVCTRFYYW
jgi:hypothetical protein